VVFTAQFGMPEIRREKVPEALLRHLILRARERKITMHDLGEFSDWLAKAPTVPEGKWFKRFATFTACGEGELVKTFLLPGQLADGEEAL
jgi:hypothetical protein